MGYLDVISAATKLSDAAKTSIHTLTGGLDRAELLEKYDEAPELQMHERLSKLAASLK